MSGTRLGRKGLADLRLHLSERDLAIASRLAELRFMTVAQIEMLHFPIESFSGELSARRVARRVLERLTHERVIIRLDRRIGGVTAGSAGYIYALGPVGARLIDQDGARGHFREPSAAFLDHTLAISEVAVGLLTNQGRGGYEVLELQTEPHCWRTFSDRGGRQILRPDLFVCLGIGEYEHRLFIEVDLGTEHLPTLLRKCQAYQAYYLSDREQADYGVFPTIWWVLQTKIRAEKLDRALARLHGAVDGLFKIALADSAVRDMTGAGS
jgi:hypothetical protein